MGWLTLSQFKPSGTQTSSRMQRATGKSRAPCEEVRWLTKRRWGVALSTRSGPDYLYYPMGRETVMTAVSWPEGEYPTWTPVSGEVSVWGTPAAHGEVKGAG